MERYEPIEWTNTIFENQGQADKKRILVFGDSIMRDGVRNELKKLLGDSVYVDLYATSRSYESEFFDKEVGFFLNLCKYDTVFITIGGHDMEMGADVFYKEYEELYLKVKAIHKDARILLGTFTPIIENNSSNIYKDSNSKVIERNECARKLAEKYELTLVDNYSVVDGKYELKVPDGVHFKEEGYKLMAENLKKYLSEY